MRDRSLTATAVSFDATRVEGHRVRLADCADSAEAGEKLVAPLVKDMVADQTTRNIHEKLNTGGLNFDVTEGYGYSAASTSTAWVMAHGGYDNQFCEAVLKYVSPTTAGSEDIGVLLRCLSLDSPNATYYYARCDAGDAEIMKIVDGSFTTLASSVYALPQNELVTITFTAVGSTLVASFSAATPGDVTISAVDTDIPSGGSPGVRSISSTVRCRSITCRQLP